MPDETKVEAHYAQSALLDRIRAGLDALGHASPLRPEVLSPVDEFHIGGRVATEPFMQALGIAPGQSVLDLGCGLGGPARYAADVHGAKVTGIDLTEDFVTTGRALNDMTGLADKVTLMQGSILDLPMEDDSFDAAYIIHVGMNIADKARIATEAARVLRPGGRFGLYEVMHVGEGAMDYPAPWAATPEQSALDSPDAYRDALTGAGFEILSETDRTGFARDFFARLASAQTAADGPPPLGLHIVMGADTQTKVRHMVGAIGDGRIAPIEMIACLPG